MAKRYDPDGSSADFLQTETFTIFKESQLVKLGNPAFLESIKVYWYDDSTGTAVKKEVDEEYFTPVMSGSTIVDEDADNAVAVAMANPGYANLSSFSEDIITKFKFLGFGTGRLKDSNFKIEVEYQAFSLDQYSDIQDFDTEGPRYSPGMMKKLIDRVTVLEGNTSIGSLFGTSLNSHDILEEDLTGIATENFVKYETHTMNVAAGINYLQPAKGAFYPSDLEIFVPVKNLVTLSSGTREQLKDMLFIYTDTSRVSDNSAHVSTEYQVVLTNEVMNELIANLTSITGYAVNIPTGDDVHDAAIQRLTLGTDYVLGELDVGRTARTHSTSGVYRNIKFLSNINSEVMISYRAFGGEISIEDIRGLQQQITNTRSVLDGTGIVTASTIGSQSVITDLYARMRRMEEYHNHFNQVEHRVSTVTPGMHWFNIAAIYDVNWGTALRHIRDVGHFKIASHLRKWVYEFTVDVDVNRAKPGDVMRVRTLASNQECSHDPSTFVDQIFRDQIAVRLCWIDQGQDSGVVLQIGWDFNGYREDNWETTGANGYPVDTDTIIVTNMSGAASAWNLLSDPSQVNYPSNGLISVYQHSKYVVTNDTTFQSGKSYFKFVGQYIYVKTADEYIREGKTYYSNQHLGSYLDTGTGTVVKKFGYVEINSSVNPDAVPGAATSKFIEDVLDDDGNPTGETALNLYEKVLFGHYPAKQSVGTDSSATYHPGDSITEDLYEFGDEYDESNGFSMPNPLFIWDASNTAAKHYQCVAMLEPVDGVIGWIGSMNLSSIAPGYGKCTECPESDDNPSPTEDVSTTGVPSSYKSLVFLHSSIQNSMSPKSVKAMTIVVYDRRDNRYLAVKSPCAIGYDENSVYSEFSFCLEDMCIASINLNKILSTDSSVSFTDADSVRRYHYMIETMNSGDIATFSYADPAADAYFLQLEVKTVLGTSSLINERFDLRMIKLHF